ncbi:MAG: tetratricopeptide repeat protein, partial [Nannocystaceae bacterium]
LWEALWGRPFEGELRGMALAKHEGPPALPRGTKVPRTIQDAIRRGLAPVIEERWPSMAALLEALAYDPAAKRRRWQRAGFVTVAAVAVAGALAVGQIDASSPCEDASAQMVGVWDDETRAEVGAALESTELSYAQTTWERVRRHLDEYAVSWAQMHREACEATAVHKVQSEALLDRRMQCLRRHRLRMAATVDVLRTADTTVVESAIEQVMELPSIDRCADTEALLAEVPPPEDPAIAAAVRVIGDELTRTEALVKAGRYDDGQAQLEALIERARPLGYAPLEAELLILSSRVADEQGAFELARDRGSEGYELALASGATSSAAEAAMNLIMVTGNRLAEPRVGQVWAASARALAQRADPRGGMSASVLNAMGVLAYREGDFKTAVESFEQALPVMLETRGEDNDGVATTLNNLGAMLDEQSRYTEAEPHFRRALAIHTKIFGADHPRTTASIDNLALCLQAQGRNEESRQLHERTLEIRERALGPDNPATGIAHNNLGWDLMGLAQPDAAAEHFARGLGIFETAMGPKHPRVAMASESLALAELERGRYTESEALHRRALEIRRRSLGEDHPNVALSLNGLGKLAHEQQQFEEAVRLHEQALAIIEAKSEGAERYLAEALMDLGKSLVEVGRFAAARAHLERSLDLREGGGTDPVVLGEARFALARAIAGEGGDTPAARAQATEARRTLDGIEGEAARRVRERIDAWLSPPAGE